MKLATLASQNPKNRHGDLILVSKDNRLALRTEPAVSLLEALQSWSEWSPRLKELSQQLNSGKASGAFTLDLEQCIAPLPNTYGFFDGSAFLSHVVRARRARGDQMPESAKVTPLMYQGVADNALAWNAPIDLMDKDFGGDFEGEFGVITTDVPKGTPSGELGKYIALVTLFNDITYREIVKTEIETKFGFLQSKPNSAYAPIVVTPDELGNNWDGNRLALEVLVKLNGALFGHPSGREMHFGFPDLVAHACRTRPLSAGTIVGSGTVSNEATSAGFACLTEKRFQEIIDTGKPITPWLKPNDHLEMDVLQNGVSVFGKIDQTVVLNQ